MDLFDLAFLLAGILILLFVIFSIQLTKKAVNFIALVILFVCTISLLGSIFFVGGWDGMAVGILTGSTFAGLVFGWLISLIIFSFRKN